MKDAAPEEKRVMVMRGPGAAGDARPTKARGERPRAFATGLLVTVAATLFFTLTGARGAQWGDPAKLTLEVFERSFNLSQESHSGLILWSLPFSFLPLEPYTWRMHFSAALTAGLALGVAFATLVGVGVARTAALFGVAAVAVAHTLWFTSTIFESYPLVLLIVASALWLVAIAKKPGWAGLLIGMGVSAHPLTAFGLPGIAWGVWRSTAGGMRRVVRLGAGFVAGVLLGFAATIVASGSGLDAFNWGEATSSYGGLRHVLRNPPLLVGYALYNFASPALLLLIAGWRRLPRDIRIAGILFALPHYLFALFWLPQRSYLVPLPVYFVMALPIALGAERLMRWRPALRAAVFALVLLMPVAAYLIAPGVFRRVGLDRTVRDAPYREEATYFLRPWKAGERSADAYLQDLDAFLPRDAAVIGDWVLYTTLLTSQRVSGWRPDVTIINADQSQCPLIAGHIQRRTRMYVLDDEYLPECLLAQGRMVKVDGIESLAELIP